MKTVNYDFLLFFLGSPEAADKGPGTLKETAQASTLIPPHCKASSVLPHTHDTAPACTQR